MTQAKDVQVWVVFLDRLLSKTKKKAVEWEGPRISEGWVVYSVWFPKSSIDIGYNSPANAADSAAAWFYNVDRAQVYKIMAEEDEPGWDLLVQLFWEARRTKLKWDETLSDLTDQLEGDAGVGMKPEGSETDADLPF